MQRYGETDYQKKRIRINPEKGDVIDTILHEKLHKKYPNKSEKWIRKKTNKMQYKMSVKKMMKTLKQFV